MFYSWKAFKFLNRSDLLYKIDNTELRGMTAVILHVDLSGLWNRFHQNQNVFSVKKKETLSFSKPLRRLLMYIFRSFCLFVFSFVRFTCCIFITYINLSQSPIYKWIVLSLHTIWSKQIYSQARENILV